MGYPGLQGLSDFRNVEFAACYPQDKLLSTIDVVIEVNAIHNQEDPSRRPCNSLIPVDERMISGQRMEQGCGLEHESRIGEFTENRRLWSRHRRLDEPSVSYCYLGQDATRDEDDVVESEVVDLAVHYLLNRSRSSASRVATNVIALASRWSRLETYCSIARFATSCMERPSSSAHLRKASV